MGYLFTSESVSEGHPDKVADQISDAVLDKLLAYDPSSKVACETLVTTGQVVLAGEVKTKAYIDLQRVAREVINKIGYTKSEYMFEGNSCGVFSAIHEQSPDINRGVEREDPMNQGAGDQGMMFGYATNETENYMPLSLDLAHKLLMVLADIRREGKVMTYLRPDSKSQVTIEYDDNRRPVRIDTIVVSTQHDEFIQPADNSQEAQLKADEEMLAQIRKDVIEILMPRVIAEIHNPEVLKLFNDQIKYFVNPTGKFVIGGPHGDTGLTGRKIIVDNFLLIYENVQKRKLFVGMSLQLVSLLYIQLLRCSFPLEHPYIVSLIVLNLFQAFLTYLQMLKLKELKMQSQISS